MSKELKWGETPFDGLSRDELLRLCQKMYAATEALYSVANLNKLNNPDSPFWGSGGTGGRGLEMGRQVLEPIKTEYNSEDIYRAFFRYATDLLFEDAGVRVGSGWAVCPKCGRMFGRGSDGVSQVGERCGDIAGGFTKCDGIMRPLQWSDLQPTGAGRGDAEPTPDGPSASS